MRDNLNVCCTGIGVNKYNSLTEFFFSTSTIGGEGALVGVGLSSAGTEL
jgi:hypothetical protein